MAVDLQNQSRNDDIKLYELPDGCITSVISMTTPKDACKMELVASWCGACASSDGVWEKFVPADYLDILRYSLEGQKLLDNSVSKKDLYLRMCDSPLLTDQGKKSLSLDKPTGKRAFMLSAKALAIVWSHTEAYWKFIRPPEFSPESRFTWVAKLLMVCWLEIEGAINSKMLSPNTKYAAYMVFTAVEESLYGFDYPPVEVSVGFSGQECETHPVILDRVGPGARQFNYRHPDAAKQSTASLAHIQKPKQRRDGFLEIELGEIYVKGDEDGDVQMRLIETKGGHWKSGLLVEGFEIRPKHE